MASLEASCVNGVVGLLSCEQAEGRFEQSRPRSAGLSSGDAPAVSRKQIDPDQSSISIGPLHRTEGEPAVACVRYHSDKQRTPLR